MYTIEYQGHKTTLLSTTEAMSCLSFSIPAGQEGSCPFSVARDENDVCKGCYAQLGRYNMPTVQKAQWIRFEWLKENLKTIDGQKIIINAFVEALKSVKNGYFRIHDSGDFFSPAYINLWTQICMMHPKIKFWAPTRSWRATNKHWELAFDGLLRCSNVCIRPSAIKFNEMAPRVKNFGPGSTVINSPQILNLAQFKLTQTQLCPKTVNGGSCESNSCRSCWNSKLPVAYLVHGSFGRHKFQDVHSQKMVDNRASVKKYFTQLTLKQKVLL